MRRLVRQIGSTIHVISVTRKVGLFIAFGAAISAHARSDEPRDLVKQMIEALNSKQDVTIRGFIQTHVVPNVPVEQRMARWKQLSADGAPFRVVRDLPHTGDLVKVIVVDRNGARIGWVVHYQTSPTEMITGLQLSAAFNLEGVPPELVGWKTLNSLTNKIRLSAESPAMGIAVVRNGQMSVAVVGIRKARGNDPASSDDAWSIGSIGKPLCSTVIARLIETGKLRWDETLKEALPGVPMERGYEKVTLEQIMHHRGGIPEDLGFRMDQVQKILGSAKTPLAVRDAYVRDILMRKPAAAPDTQFIYSNAGYALLSHIAEKATGKAYEHLLHELVFAPLGLTHSFTSADIMPKHRLSGHVDAREGLEPADMTGPMEYMFAGAGGGTYMSVGDLAKFAEQHLIGLRGHDGLLKASTVIRLHKGFPEGPRGQRIYACGWGIETLPGIQTFHGHNGSNGTMRAQMAIFPNANLVVVAIVNKGGENEPAPGMLALLAIADRYAKK